MDWEAFYNSFRKPGFIPGYEIQNRLGGGAFGDVYKARKTSIGKPYAIKFLKVEDDVQREAVERELAQVRHFAAIDHPNLVSIEDLGTVMGVPYLIMGYAGEDTLARRLKAGRLEREEALLYFTQTCRGVLALHDRRLVHFDLKPSNVFLKGDVARVGDYGLSKLLVDGRMTLSFGRGTPQYMAPEILRSRADHRADIYSLGVLLYESLAGRLPYLPDTEGGLVLREEDVPPDFEDDFPVTLRPAVERCLRLAPDDRFADVGELLEALGQTARQGDSVRFDWAAEAPPFGGPGTPPPGAGERAGSSRLASGTASGTAPTPRSSDELRETAAHLARGAVEVARGVWDGLRSGSSATTERSADDLSDVPAARELEPREGAVPGAREGAVPGSRARVRIHARFRSTGPDGTPQERVVEAALAPGVGPRARALVFGLGRRALTAPASFGGPPGRTIPVPPRVEGGALGAVRSSVVVAFEVLMALLGNVARGAAGVLRGAAERTTRSSGGFFGRAVRTLGFLLLMAVLGFVVMMLGMILLDALGGSA